MKRVLVAVLLTLSAAAVNAAITYEINRTIGAGTVTGFIKTDGTTGLLGETNIEDWSIELFAPNIDDGTPETFGFGSGDTILRGDAVSATLTELTFDFTTQRSGFLLLMSDSTGNFWCLETTLCPGADFSEQIGVTTGGDVAQFENYTGEKVVFANAVPVPAAVWLFGSGLLGLIGLAIPKK